MKPSIGTFVASLLAAGAAVMSPNPAAAESAADFYRGKTITYIVATDRVGNTSIYGRLIAKYMEKYIPGGKIIAKNVPSTGAGQIVGANQLYAAKPDGLTIGAFNARLIYDQLLAREEVKFDLAKMTYLGNAASNPRLFVVGANTSYRSFDDLKRAEHPVRVAVSGLDSNTYNGARLLVDLLQLNIDIVPVSSGKEAKKAMQRGEVEGVFDKSRILQSFVAKGLGRILFQIGGAPGQGDEGVSRARDLVSGEKGRSLVTLIAAPFTLRRVTVGPPGVPADRVALLRDAYRKAVTDPGLLAKMEELRHHIEPMFGDDVRRRIEVALNQSPETVAKLAAVVGAKIAWSTVKTTLLMVKGKGKVIKFKDAEGRLVRTKVGGSRTTITIDGKKAKRSEMAEGMVCVITYAPGGTSKPSTSKPSLIECES